MQSKQLKVNHATDLCKVICKAVRELGERDGSSLKNIEKYIRQSHTVEEESDGDLRAAIKLSAKRGVDRGQLIQDDRLFRLAEKSSHQSGKKHHNQSHDASFDSGPKVNRIIREPTFIQI